MSDPLDLRRMLGDIIIGVQDKEKCPYAGDYAREIEHAIISGALPIFKERDILWCNALIVLDPRDIQSVLKRFNDSRPDKE